MKLIYIIGCLLFILACNSTDTISSLGNKPKHIILSNDNSILKEIHSSEIETVKIDTLIHIKSRIQYSTTDLHYLTFPIPGFLKSAKKNVGDKVSKGEIIAQIEHPKYIELKRDYLKAKTDFDYYKQNYSRQGELAIEQATSIKNMQISERNYKNSEAELKYLEASLKLIGINAEKLDVNSLTAIGYIHSPASGVIVEANSIPGEYYGNSDKLYQISTNPAFVTKFSIKNKYIHKLKIKDNLKLHAIGKCEDDFEGTITSILESNEQSLIQISSPLKNENWLRVGNTVEFVVPVEQIFLKVPLKTVIDNEWIIIQKSENIFERINVKPYKLEVDYLIISYDKELANSKIVIQGAEKIMSVY